MGTQDFHFSGRELPDYIRLSDTRASGVAGTSYISGGYRTLVLNTEEQDDGGHCALASNQITLSAGTYAIKIVIPSFDWSSESLTNLLRVRNTTGSANVLKWPNFYLSASEAYQSGHFTFDGRFTINASQALELQIDKSTTSNLLANTDGDSEIYLTAELWKLA
jgi:hypothetical protein